jgi:hypothetical protein
MKSLRMVYSYLFITMTLIETKDQSAYQQIKKPLLNDPNTSGLLMNNSVTSDLPPNKITTFFVIITRHPIKLPSCPHNHSK